MSSLVRNPSSRFIKVKCPDCTSEQVTFNRVAVRVNCQACGATLVEPSGGLANIKGEIVDTLE